MKSKNKHHLNDLNLCTTLNTDTLGGFSGDVVGGEVLDAQIFINGVAITTVAGTLVYTGVGTLAGIATVSATAVA